MKFIYSITIILVLFIGCKPKQTTATTEKQSKEAIELTVDEPRDSTSLLVINSSEANNMKDQGDPYTIESAEIKGDELWLAVSYGGGCKEHQFEMLFNNAYMESVPEQIQLSLKHQGNNDMCRSIVQQNIRFDLKTVQLKGASKLNINLTDWEEVLNYMY